MKRPGYREAVEWIAFNDDTEWLDEEADYRGGPSVAAVMVSHLFDVEIERLERDLRRVLKRTEEYERLRGELATGKRCVACGYAIPDSAAGCQRCARRSERFVDRAANIQEGGH